MKFNNIQELWEHQAKKYEDNVALFETLAYITMNIWYFLFYKQWVDRKIKRYLSRKYSKKDTIVLAIHGLFEYYWQSFTRYIKYFDKKERVIISLRYNYFKSDKKSLEKITKDIESIHKKIKCQIILTGDCHGGIGTMYMLKTNGKYVKEFIPIATPFSRKKHADIFGKIIKLVIHRKKEDVEFERKLKRKIPKTKIAIYGTKDYFVKKKGCTLKSLRNIPFATGHFGILYNMEVIKFLYDYTFGR